MLNNLLAKNRRDEREKQLTSENTFIDAAELAHRVTAIIERLGGIGVAQQIEGRQRLVVRPALDSAAA